MSKNLELQESSRRESFELFVTSRVEFLTDVGVWPISEIVDPNGWLTNFRECEKPFAMNLLNVFFFYNENLVNALLRAAFMQLAQDVIESAPSHDRSIDQWQRFLSTVLITYVEGECPNPTDSGLMFARKARQVLGMAESQIVHPSEALKRWQERSCLPIMFVDDFIGSGRQMIHTWGRPYRIASEQKLTFEAASARGADIFYAPLVATKKGMQEIARKCPRLRLFPANTIDETYSLTDPNSTLWEEDLRTRAPEFLRVSSERAGIVEELGEEWDGFENLALSLAFFHSVPDAILPLYYWDRCGWKPLVRRS